MPDDLRSRLASVIGRQHREGSLVSAEVDAVMEVIDERDAATLELIETIAELVASIERKVDHIIATRRLLDGVVPMPDEFDIDEGERYLGDGSTIEEAAAMALGRLIEESS